MNPFNKKFDVPFGSIPFDKIEFSHFENAIEQGIIQQNNVISKIIFNKKKPNFRNTIKKLEYSDSILKRVTHVLFNLSYANTTPEIQSLMQKMAPALSAHSDSIFMNKKLWKRIDKVFNSIKVKTYKGENLKLINNYYQLFIRNGAKLSNKNKKILININQELALLSLNFSKNILETTNEYQLVIRNKKHLKGLPDSIITAAAETACSKGLNGAWVFTLHNSSVIPFLQYAENRDLREEIWKAMVNKCNGTNKNDNIEIIKKLVTLRNSKSKMLGYKSYAHYVLEDRMAKTPNKVISLLDSLWKPALSIADNERTIYQEMINKSGHGFDLQPWDWRYYENKYRKAYFDFNEEDVRPYFKLENVEKGIFTLAKRLFGIEFISNPTLSKYHEDIKAFEVKEANQTIGVLYLDYFPRESKQGGAWMTSYQVQYKKNKECYLPLISIVCNFSKPTISEPSKLTYDEVNTLFHEFGHALHGLLSNVRYPSLSGTNVSTDFVELPSQIMENWSLEKIFIEEYAIHYQSGIPMPSELIEKLITAQKFGQGFATVEYLAASYLDMFYHLGSINNEIDINAWEKAKMKKIGLPSAILPRYRSTYFNHIFGGGYAAGYYSYIWSEVLDSDAYSMFKKKGIYDHKTASSFRKHILSKGGSQDAMILYKKFRGSKPTIQPLLKKRGLLIDMK